MLDLRLRNSDQGKLDNSYIEKGIFSLFRIDIINFISNKAALAKNFHIQPSEIDKMPMWEYELFMTNINNMVKQENDEQQKEMGKYNINDYKKMASNKQSKIPKPNIPKI